jgi:hypothetical protein
MQPLDLAGIGRRLEVGNGLPPEIVELIVAAIERVGPGELP